MNKIVFLFFLLLSNFLNAQDIKQILRCIPKHHLEALNSLFYELFIDDNFAYTLFGDKPVSLYGNFTLTPLGNSMNGLGSGGVFWNKWEIWNKYSHLFTIEDFIFLEETSQHHNDIRFVILINKKSFLRALETYRNDFDYLFSKYGNSQNILNLIELKNISFQVLINNDEYLWGILLGYGKHNAKLFGRKCSVKLKRKHLECLAKPELIEKMDKKIVNYEEKLQPFGDLFYPPFFIRSVHFMADANHPESKELKKKYDSLREEISTVCSEGSYLETILTKLTN